MTTLPDLHATLEKSPVFSCLDKSSIGKLAEIARHTSFKRGEIIFRQDDPPPGIYVVASGMIRVYKLAPSGKEHVLHLAGPLQTFAEVAVVAGIPCPAFAEAVEDSHCVMLPTKSFQELLDRDHILCRQVLSSMSFWVRHLLNLLEDIVLRDAIGRVARYLLTFSGEQNQIIQLPGLKKHLASHLNLTSETLSRTLRRLSESGLIENRGGQEVAIIDPGGLEAAAAGAFPQI